LIFGSQPFETNIHSSPLPPSVQIPVIKKEKVKEAEGPGLQGLPPPKVDLSRFKRYIDPDLEDEFESGEEEEEKEPEGPGLSSLPPPKINFKFNRFDDDEEPEGPGLSSLPPPKINMPSFQRDEEEEAEGPGLTGLPPPKINLPKFQRDEEEEPEGPGLSSLPPPKISMKFNRYDDDEDDDGGGGGLASLPPPTLSFPKRYDPDEYSDEDSEDYDYYDDEDQVGQIIHSRRKSIIYLSANCMIGCVCSFIFVDCLVHIFKIIMFNHHQIIFCCWSNLNSDFLFQNERLAIITIIIFMYIFGFFLPFLIQ